MTTQQGSHRGDPGWVHRAGSDALRPPDTGLSSRCPRAFGSAESRSADRGSARRAREGIEGDESMPEPFGKASRGRCRDTRGVT
jgi:hypothetical protein